MADTYEKNLSQKSTLTTSDYIRVVGSDNESYKQLVSDVAKKIIEDYAGSSLAGSSQSVKSAIDAVNNNMSGVVFTRSTGVGISGRTYNVGNGYRGVLIILDSSDTRCGLYLLGTSTTGTVYMKTVASAGNITINTSVSGEVTVTPDSGTRNILFITSTGTIS